MGLFNASTPKQGDMSKVAGGTEAGDETPGSMQFVVKSEKGRGMGGMGGMGVGANSRSVKSPDRLVLVLSCARLRLSVAVTFTSGTAKSNSGVTLGTATLKSPLTPSVRPNLPSPPNVYEATPPPSQLRN